MKNCIIILIVFLISATIFTQSNKAYVTNFNDDFISVIDLNLNEKIADIKTGTNPHGIDVSPWSY